MTYIYNRGSSPTTPTFILFHGTGGRETDLLPVAQQIDMRNGILAVRGNVIENGERRYFKQLANGTPDLEDLVGKTDEMREFIDETAHQYAFNQNNIVPIGYSNGANIAASLLFHYGQAMKGAILFHPIVPVKNAQLPDLTGMPIFIGIGAVDTLALPGEAMKLKKMLEEAGADVNVHITDFGHELADSEVEAAAYWYAKHFRDE